MGWTKPPKFGIFFSAHIPVNKKIKYILFKKRKKENQVYKCKLKNWNLKTYDI